MRRGGLFKGAQAGMYVAVMSALETALWDPLRDAPGIGVEIDEDALRRYAVKDVPFFE
jgi:L-alanine-DL-glutamate epimerase-like enolase superfamily enzyme